MRKVRFFRWYRVIPLLIIAAIVAATVGSNYVPNQVKKILYPVQYADYIQEAADTYGVDPYLICAVIKTESNWDTNATSSAGAEGLMQLMPDTAATVYAMGLVSRYDPTNLYDPKTNIIYGTAYLSYLENHLSSDEEIIAAYNAGLGSVQKWLASGGDISQNITFSETAGYLTKVKAARTVYETLYPEGISAN